MEQTPPPRVSDICKKMGIPHSCTPVAALIYQVCATMASLTGVDCVCQKAVDTLTGNPMSPNALGKALKIRSRAVEMFCDHLCKEHGMTVGAGEIGFYWEVQHTRNTIDGLVSTSGVTGLAGSSYDVLHEIGASLVARFRISPRNLTYVLQGLVQLWILANFPAADACATIYGTMGPYLMGCTEEQELAHAEDLLDLQRKWGEHIARTASNSFLAWTSYWTGVISGAASVVLGFTIWVVLKCWFVLSVIFPIVWFPLCLLTSVAILCCMIRRIQKQRAAILRAQREAESKVNEARLLVRQRVERVNAFIDALARDDSCLEVKEHVWLSEGYDKHHFDALFSQPRHTHQALELPEDAHAETTHPAATAAALPSGTIVEFYGEVDDEVIRVGCGGVTKVAGPRAQFCTSGHVLTTWLQLRGRVARLSSWTGTSWDETRVSNPIITAIRPGSQFAAAAASIDIPVGYKPRAFLPGCYNPTLPVHYFRRGVPCLARDVTVVEGSNGNGDVFVYKGDTMKGDSGSLLYQGTSAIAVHQGTYSEKNKLNFASIGFDVSATPNDPLHDGFAESAPTGMAKEPKHAKGRKPGAYVLKAALYDGNQFGELLDKSAWTALWDFSEHKKVLVLSKVFYIAGHLLLWKWDDWVKAGRPKAFDASLFKKICNEELLGYLRGKSWDVKTKSHITRLLGRKIYPVPEESGMSATHPADSIWKEAFPAPKVPNGNGGFTKGDTPFLRDILLTRFFVEHAMQMPASEWGKIRSLKQVKTVPRRVRVVGEDGKVTFGFKDQTVEMSLEEKVRPISYQITKAQFFDKTLALGVYAAALEKKLLTDDQVPSILGQFGAREVRQWMEKATEAEREWYLHYATGLTELYPESEEVDYDGILELPVGPEEEEEEPQPSTSAGVETDDEPNAAPESPPAVTPAMNLPTFRSQCAVSSDTISVERFIQMETKLSELTSLLAQLLSQTKDGRTNDPSVKVGLLDLAAETSRIGASTAGKTMADNVVIQPKKVKVPVEQPRWVCELCNIDCVVASKESHLNGLKHFKRLKDAGLVNAPASILPSAEAKEEEPVPEGGVSSQDILDDIWECPTCVVDGAPLRTTLGRKKGHLDSNTHKAATLNMDVHSFLAMTRGGEQASPRRPPKFANWRRRVSPNGAPSGSQEMSEPLDQSSGPRCKLD
ncbi:MAG: zinc finger protein [Hangzhou astrovirus 1]|nr:MAG: zinc finger protein [Hangzhou astrovirus 1]